MEVSAGIQVFDPDGVCVMDMTTTMSAQLGFIHCNKKSDEIKVSVPPTKRLYAYIVDEYENSDIVLSINEDVIRYYHLGNRKGGVIAYGIY